LGAPDPAVEERRDKKEEIQGGALSQRPSYDGTGPHMTARFVEVKCSTGKISTKLGMHHS